MLHKQPNSVITLTILLALVGVSRPAKAFLIAQSDSNLTTFTVPEQLPENAKVQIAASNSTSSINQSLTKSFIEKFPQAQINIETQEAAAALKSLSSGTADLVAIGRSLTAAEKAQGFVEVPISREKIAIVVSKDSDYDGASLSISQLAQIFKGEIKNWSELGGSPGQIQVIDLPDTNDTRQAFPSYPVFQAEEFSTGSNAVQLEQNSIEEMIAQLGEQGIGYAVASDVINRDDVKVIALHQTQPDDPKYPFSQPVNLIYKETPSKAAQAFLGFATTDAGQQIIDNRVGSFSTAAAKTIADSNLKNKSLEGDSKIASPSEAEVDSITEDDANVAEEDIAESGELNPDIAGSGELNPDIAGSGELNPDVAESGELNPDIAGSGELNPDIAGSGEPNPDIAESGQANSKTDLEEQDSVATADTNSATIDEAAIANADLDGNAQANPETDSEEQDSVATADTNSATIDEAAIANADLNGNAQANPETDLEEQDSVATADVKPDSEANSIANETNAESQNTANKGKSWWWLLILLLPLAALALYLFGRKEKSDQEPAVSSFLDPNAPQGEGNFPVAPTDNLSSGSSTISSDHGSVASETVGNASKVGGATLATGGAAIAGSAAAASNLVGSQTRAEEDVDLDQIVLDEESNNIDLEAEANADTDANLDLEDPVVEIPSNPVNEFTDQKTKLQVTDQPTKLQFNEEDETDNVASSLLDDVIQTEDVALSDEAGASGFFTDSEYSDTETAETANTSDDVTSAQPSDVSEQPTILQTDEIDQVNVLDQSFNEPTTEVNRLNAEADSIEDITTSEVDLSLDEESTDNTPGFIDRVSSAGDAAIAGGGAALGGAAAAASGFFTNQDTEQTTELQENELEFSSEETTSNDFADNIVADAETSPLNLETNDELASEETEFSLETPDINLVSDSVEEIASPEVDFFLDEDEDEDSTDNAPGFVDRVSSAEDTAIAGGAAAASGFFTNQDTEQTTELQENELELSLEETTSNDFADNIVADAETSPFNLETNDELAAEGTNLSAETPDITSGSIDGVDTFDMELSTAEDIIELQDLDDTELTLEEITSNEFASDVETTPSNLNTSLDEIAFDDVDNSEDLNFDEITFEDSDDSINASLEELTFDNINNLNIDNSEDLDLEEITFDDDNSIDEFLNDTSTVSDDQEISLDDLGFNEINDSSTSDLANSNITPSSDLFDDQADDANDISDISQWLDNLETPDNNADNISEWLDQLAINTTDNNLEQENPNNENELKSKDDAEDISFQFLEDLLERDSNTNQDN
ncbi:substrate-binding domain-containing protein [Pleurocapsa sp. PCC 7319]|uniref:substrate-binding domain-containing protein n=1 Tax=Pleurocapsa sp. PCC 7319 TaxID=118161 RepID=UPI00034C04EF|nr:substrate-binding domain-containing protein [Pleurocapsa sp. PCC 7319]